MASGSTATAEDLTKHGPRRRRLSDKLFVAFHLACDQGRLDVAAELLGVIETVVGQPMPGVTRDRRQIAENLIAAHQRLWELRHPEVCRAD